MNIFTSHRRKPARRGALSAAAGFLVMLVPGMAGAQLNIAQDPLFVSTNAQPNVMFVMDVSGSMSNMIWDVNPDDTPDVAPYDPTVVYPNWGEGFPFDVDGDGAIQDDELFGTWDADDSEFDTDNYIDCELAGSTVTGNEASLAYGRKVLADGSDIEVCIEMPWPAPRRSERRTNQNYVNFLFESYFQTALDSGQFSNQFRRSVPRSLGFPGHNAPTQSRIEVLRSVSQELVNRNPLLRFGVTQTNSSGEGGDVLVGCGAPTSTVTNTLANLPASGGTPVGEALYEATRYFRGLSARLDPDGGTFQSPIQYRCQSNFAILISDGFPTADFNYPTDDPDDALFTDRSLPDWDNLSPPTTEAQSPNFPRFSDGFDPTSEDDRAIKGGNSLYLDDIALFANQIDMKRGGTDLSGGSFDDPEFPPQNLRTFTVGYSLDAQVLVDAAEYGQGDFFRADNAEQLLQSLQNAVSQILALTSSAAAVSTNSTQLSTDSLIFQATFSTVDWSGDLIARSVNLDGSVGGVQWQAANNIPAPASRNIVTTRSDNGSAVAFQYANLANAQRAALGGDADGPTMVAALRGENFPSDPSFRLRPALGDLVNSDPAFIGSQDFGFRRLPGTEGATYPAFVASKANRDTAVFIGGNDGMLHGFDGDTGAETFAYIPRTILPALPAYVAPDYVPNHRFFVDGATRTVDAYLNGAWKSIVIGSTGAGGTGVFAVDATNPGSMSAGSVLWEFNASNDSRMGATVPIVTAARMANGEWAGIFANGYNSASQQASLFIVNLRTGALIRRIDTNVGSASQPNGLSSPVPIDVDNDKITDVIYAGDLQGNLWKFDVSQTNPASWGSAFGSTANPAPLYVACSSDPCTTSNRQPITARPEVGLNPDGGVIVYVGTGKYFEVTDSTIGNNEPTQTFYGVFDQGSTVSGRSALLEQTVIAEGVTSGQTFRLTSDNELSTEQGWFIDLPANGERQVSTPLLRTGRVVFTTLIPNGDPCGFGGTGFIMELDALSGSRLDQTPFDLNDDGVFSEDDLIEIEIDGETVKIPVSGIQSQVGIVKTPAVLVPEDSTDPNVTNSEFKFFGGSDTSAGTGGIQSVRESRGTTQGRLSWRQIK